MNSFGSLSFSRFRQMAWLGLASAFVLTGCSSIQVRLGQRISLAKTPVTSIEASLSKDPGIAPGQKASLIATLIGPNGAVLVTEGAGKGKVLWKDLAVTTSVVSVNKKGVLSLPRDPRVSDGKTGHVTITVPSQPSVRADLDVPVRYDISFVSNFSGSGGSIGFNGTDGMSGSSGSMGSIDGNNPSAGGDATDGTNGSDGQDGGSGGDGPSVQMRVALRSGTHPLLQLGVSAAGHKERFYLVDPQGGSLSVTSSGGAGGSGGKGGRGGNGGSGGIGIPSGQNGRNGLDGRDGSNGTAGNAGAITVIYDPQTKPFLTALHIGGHGGPQPVFEEEAVAPLW
ncbi:hypothetical protein RBB75_07785 [Tunturibacter empetritectus]|uniref:Collagen-like protein n=1 Tax=Tunturiibacter empetritectus TaxID=3069691 RepID=A0AAU7ZGP0_9BACT